MEIRGKAPLRVSFAGGGTDLNYIFEKYGGAVVSSTIDKYCHMSIKKREDTRIFINGSEFTEPLAFRVVQHFKPAFGFDLTYYNDLPPGSGLGSSSSFTVLLLRLLYELNGSRMNDYDIIKEAYKIETGMKEGGWQDQYAASFGGFNFMEFGKDKTLIYPLRLKYSFICEFNEHFVLCNIGGSRAGRDIHKELREYSEKNLSELKRTAKIKELAYRMRDCLLNSNLDDVGNILDENWQLKKNQFTSNSEINELYEQAKKHGAIGGKICGAGGAGHFLFFCKPEDKHKLINFLKTKYEIINFNFGTHGTETWKKL